MALLTELPLAAAQELGHHYGLTVTGVEALAAGSVNSNFRLETADGGRYFARLYEEQDSAGAERELALLEGLARDGVPLARPLTGARGGLSVWSGKPFAVFPWIEGEILCQARVRQEHCHAVGAALARMHLCRFDAERLGPGRFNPADMLRRLERVERDAERSELIPDVRRIRQLLEYYQARRDASLPRGVVHGDLFRDNVLWSGSRVLALLDFESAFHGPLIYDLAVTIEAWCFADAFRPELVGALARGYAEVRRPVPAEIASFTVEAALGCLRFATSRITDFSLRAPPGTPPARDFRRFLSRLAAIESGALEPALAALGA